MKILLSNNHLKFLAGSETFTYTLAVELKRQGHKVEVFTFIDGQVTRRLSQAGIRVLFGRTSLLKIGDYDIILANHTSTVDRLYKHGLIIQTIHGLKPILEKPNRKADKFVSISKEIQGHLLKQGIKSDVLLNGIDCQRFDCKKALNDKLKTVLSLSHSAALNERLKGFFAKRDIQLITYNKLVNPVWEIENYINEADMVISLGRGCYEALACGRAVVVADKRPYQPEQGDGLLTSDNIDRSIYHNCSGRAFMIRDTEALLDEAIEYYNHHSKRDISGFSRSFALENLNIQKQAVKYLEYHPDYI